MSAFPTYFSVGIFLFAQCELLNSFLDFFQRESLHGSCRCGGSVRGTEFRTCNVTIDNAGHPTLS